MAGGCLAGVVAAALLLLAIIPWGLLAGGRVRALSVALGRTVTVEDARRLDRFGLTPTIELRGVTIAQPAWAGRGTFARIAAVRLRFPVLPLLVGRLRPRSVVLRGVQLMLVRDAAGRANWSGPRRDGAGDPLLEGATVRDGRFRLVDLRRHAVLSGTFATNGTGRLRIAGEGALRGRPLRLLAIGGAAERGRPWPLRVAVRSPLVRLDAALLADRPYALTAFSADLHAEGQDLRFLDDVVQAGLFPTARFQASASVRRDGDSWRVSHLIAQLPATRITDARLLIRPSGTGRTRLTGAVRAKTFSFADFASEEDRARAAARLRALGRRVLPATPLDLPGLARLDGELAFGATHLVGAEPFQSLTARVQLDHRRLRLDPVSAGLRSGRLDGWLTVDARGGVPAVRLDARVAGGTFEGLVANAGAIRGALTARVRLAGRGRRFDAALGGAHGAVGLSVTRGSVRRDVAVLASGNLVRSVAAMLLGGAADRVPLRCLAGILPVHGGIARPAALVIDTPVSRADASGRVDLARERVDLLFRGRPKQAALIRVAPAMRLSGTFAGPRVATAAPPGVGGLRAILGTLHLRSGAPRDRPAPDADCAALSRRALG